MLFPCFCNYTKKNAWNYIIQIAYQENLLDQSSFVAIQRIIPLLFLVNKTQRNIMGCYYDGSKGSFEIICTKGIVLFCISNKLSGID